MKHTQQTVNKTQNEDQKLPTIELGFQTQMTNTVLHSSQQSLQEIQENTQSKIQKTSKQKFYKNTNETLKAEKDFDLSNCFQINSNKSYEQNMTKNSKNFSSNTQEELNFPNNNNNAKHKQKQQHQQQQQIQKQIRNNIRQDPYNLGSSKRYQSQDSVTQSIFVRNNQQSLNDQEISQQNLNQSTKLLARLDNSNDNDEKQQFYKLKSVNYQNYRYNKSNQQSISLSKRSSQNIFQRQCKTGVLEQTISSKKLQNSILDIDINKDDDNIEDHALLQQMLVKIQDKNVQMQTRVAPFQLKDRIAKNLKKLDQNVQTINKNVSCTNIIVNQQWLPPIMKYKESEQDRPVLQKKTKKKDKNDDESEDDGLVINVLHLNKAFYKKGMKLQSYFDCPHPHNNEIIDKMVDKGEVNKILHRKFNSNLIIDEYNRLLNIEKTQRAINSNSNRRPSDIRQKTQGSSIQQFKLNSDQNYISEENFLENNRFFNQNIRSDGDIRNRILFAIRLPKCRSLSFDSINLFYKIFVIKSANFEEKLKFLCKFFKFDKHFFTTKDLTLVLQSLCIKQDQIMEQQLYTPRLNFSQPVKLLDYIFDKMKDKKVDIENLQPIKDTDIENFFLNDALDADFIIKLMYAENMK